MQHNNDEKVSLKEFWDRFYQLRDVEIQNLWQRTSIFAGFIGLLFAGYGYIILENFGPGSDNIKVDPNNIKTYLVIHALSCGIATLGIIFSIFWITFAKGAKAWFGVHERKICEIEKEEELGIPERFRMGELSYPAGNKEPNNCLLSTRSGGFSVSKLNILLGQVLLICWSLIGLPHAYLLVSEGCSHLNLPFSGCNTWLFLIPIVLMILFAVLIIRLAKSESLLSTKKKYKEERIKLLKNELKSLIDGDKDNHLLEKVDKDPTLSLARAQALAEILEKVDKDPTLSFILDRDIPAEARKRIEREREIRTELEKKKKKWMFISFLINLEQQIKKHLDI